MYILKTFFLLNTGIKRLAINDVLLWCNLQLIKPAGLKFDVLAIEHDMLQNKLPKLDSFYRLLNELYEENGFYKNLYFYSPWRFDQYTIDQLEKLNKLLKLRKRSISDRLNFSALVNLEELCFNESCRISDLKSFPITLINLKRIHFFRASSDDILPFIQRA